MKKTYNLFFITCLLLLSLSAVSQPPPPPSNPSTTGGNAPVGSSGAPVGSGTLLLIGMAGLYAGKKVFSNRESTEEKN